MKENLRGTVVLITRDGDWVHVNVLRSTQPDIVRIGTHAAGALAVFTAEYPLEAGVYEWDGTAWQGTSSMLDAIIKGGWADIITESVGALEARKLCECLGGNVDLPLGEAVAKVVKKIADLRERVAELEDKYVYDD